MDNPLPRRKEKRKRIKKVALLIIFLHKLHDEAKKLSTFLSPLFSLITFKFLVHVNVSEHFPFDNLHSKFIYGLKERGLGGQGRCI